MVSKSFYPLGQVGTPADVKFEGWSAPPPNAAMLAFGNLGVSGNGMTVQGWLYDVKNVTSPQVLGKQYQDAATSDAARTIAHKFADEIIFRLGGGIRWNCREQDLFREQPQRPQRNLGDGLRRRQPARRHPPGLDFAVAAHFARWFAPRFQFGDQDGLGDPDVFARSEPHWFHFPRFGGTNLSPAWSPDGTKLAFSSSRSGDPEIYSVDASGANLKRLTSFKGPDVSPAWNRKTGRTDRVGQRTHRAAADLHHGVRRHQRAAADRPGLCGFALVVAERTVSGRSPGCATTARERRERRTSTSWISPASSGCN